MTPSRRQVDATRAVVEWYRSMHHGSDDDIGNWTDPLGLASLWVEGAVVLTAGYALAPRTVAATRPLKIGPLET